MAKKEKKKEAPRPVKKAPMGEQGPSDAEFEKEAKVQGP